MINYIKSVRWSLKTFDDIMYRMEFIKAHGEFYGFEWTNRESRIIVKAFRLKTKRQAKIMILKTLFSN